MKKKAYFLFGMFVFGFLMSGSYFLMMFKSGTHLATKATLNLESVINSKAAMAARRDAESYKPIQISLLPEMNLVGLSLIMKRNRGSGTAEYELEVYSPDRELVKTLNVTCRNDQSSAEAGAKTQTAIYDIGRIEVEQSGNYEMQLKPKERQGLRVISLDLRISKNATEPPIALMIAGALFGFLGMFGGIFAALIASLQKQVKKTKNQEIDHS